MNHKALILIIDDEPQIRKLLEITLESEGYKTLMAATAHEGMALAAGHQPDMILLDLGLPDLDGQEVLKRLREWYAAPIIMLTAYAEKSKVEQARDAGVTEFCAKPVTATELYKKVCAVINTPRSFIRTGVYFGPDRRRRKDDNYKGKERREALFGPKGATLLAKATDNAA